MTRQIKSLIIHCSATPNGKWFQAGEIDRWHHDRGFKRADEFRVRQNPTLAAIGYHFVILVNGSVATGRHLDEVGAHAKGYNSKSLGICLIGTDQFTPAQWDSLSHVTRKMQEHVMLLWGGDAPTVLGHRDLPGVNKTCPGFSVAEWLGDGMQPKQAHILIQPDIYD